MFTAEQEKTRDDRILSTPDPERIWLGPKCEALGDGRTWCEDPQDCPHCDLKAVQYVRLDVATAGGYRPKRS